MSHGARPLTDCRYRCHSPSYRFITRQRNGIKATQSRHTLCFRFTQPANTVDDEQTNQLSARQNYKAHDPRIDTHARDALFATAKTTTTTTTAIRCFAFSRAIRKQNTTVQLFLALHTAIRKQRESDTGNSENTTIKRPGAELRISADNCRVSGPKESHL